ncbi:heme-dependent oxidative N-demethylase family protein [Pseudalkalibacillus sp. A8]|uniref:heme-dependent oxidative N-demethylase family protein n=1 Tax=Pseudalkalibacillus sp. A8 TaxID=3382641 RepID=UPI0038B458AF
MSRINGFPFPFTKNQYAYSNDSVLLDPLKTITVTDDYKSEIELKRKLLHKHHDRCFRSLPLSIESQWETLLLIFSELASRKPDSFIFEKKGNECFFQNHFFEEEVTFLFRDASTIDLEPLDLVGRHVQEDLIIMGDRHDGLFLEAGQLCFPSNWSLAFVQGMEFKSIHSPVPGIQSDGFIQKVERFISKIRPGTAWERKNWSITVTNKLDTPLETYSEWGKHRKEVTAENAGDLIHLRVEVQRLFRLPMNHDVLFTIHTYLLQLNDLIQNESWLKTFYQNIKTLSEDITEYKGISTYRTELLRFLENHMEKERMER